jgi:hypothetical protein
MCIDEAYHEEPPPLTRAAVLSGFARTEPRYFLGIHR